MKPGMRDLSVSSIQDILTYQANLVNGFKSELDDNRVMYTVYGKLCTNKSEWFTSNGWYYNVPLKDLNNPQKVILLNFPMALADTMCNLRGYEYILYMDI